MRSIMSETYTGPSKEELAAQFETTVARIDQIMGEDTFTGIKNLRRIAERLDAKTYESALAQYKTVLLEKGYTEGEFTCAFLLAA